MARLQLSGITKSYGDFKAADDVAIDIADGEFLGLVGPAGCGKTTTLRIVAGFIEPMQTIFNRYPLSDKSKTARYSRAMAYSRKPDLKKALEEITSPTNDVPNNP